MARRGRRSGVRFIENDRDRSLTFFKRRSGLYKAAADLSTLTGARVAVVLESESGKFSSFGTPAAGPVVDAFLSRNAPTRPYANEEHKATITELQNELFQLEKEIVVEDKRKKESITQVKELQENSRIAKLAYGKVEDLDAYEIREMYYELSRVRQGIQHLLPGLHHGEQDEVGGMRDPSLLQPAWWRSLPSEMRAPRVLPWIPIQPTVQMMLPPRSLASSMESLQVKMPGPQEAIYYNYHIWGMDINSNNSNLPSPPSHPSSPQIPLFNESSHPPSLLPQQFLLPLSIDGQLPLKSQSYNSTELSQNFASSGSSTPTDKPYYPSLGELNIDLGKNSENGGQIDSGHHMLGFSGQLQGDGWIDELLSQSSSIGGNSGVGARNNLGGINFPWN